MWYSFLSADSLKGRTTRASSCSFDCLFLFAPLSPRTQRDTTQPNTTQPKLNPLNHTKQNNQTNKKRTHTKKELPDDPIVILGFNPQGQVLANMLASPLSQGPPIVAFDLDPTRVTAARAAGFPVLFGDGARPSVLAAAGVVVPRAVVVCHSNPAQALRAVRQLRRGYPDAMPIYASAPDFK